MLEVNAVEIFFAFFNHLLSDYCKIDDVYTLRTYHFLHISKVKCTGVILLEILYSRSVQSIGKWKKHECLSGFYGKVLKLRILPTDQCT